jgi:hypothetical protein
MPLIDLKTNLKSIKYGSDQPGGGYSGLPYIKTAIPDVLNGAGTISPIFRINSTGNLDYPIRGGNLNFNIGTQTFTLSSQIDKSRIKKFFEDAPRGTAFIQKQIGLQLSNPKIETGNTLYGIGQGAPAPGLLENTRVYNRGTNTLTQVGVSGTGAHAIRHGLMPFNPWQKNYYDIVNAQNVNDSSETNRLLILSQLKMTSDSSQIISTQNVKNINLVNNLGISLNRNLIFQYWGGPGSVYGVGTTTIKRAVDTTTLSSRNAMVYNELMSQNINNITDGVATTNIQDFRNTTQGFGWTNSPLQVDKRFYVSPGSYKDKMNLLYPFIFKNDSAPWELNKDSTDDLIKFVFEAVSNDNTNYSTALFFRAFLIAGLTDNNTATLNGFKYMGRGENFYTYQGFDRTIGFSFRVAAGSRDEIRPLYNKVNALMSQVYPDYSPQQHIMRSSIIRMTIGDYLYRVPGFLESVNITVDNTSPWEVNLEKSQTGDIAQLPQVIDIAVSFKPIMDILPRRSYITDVSRTSVAGTETTRAYSKNAALISNVEGFIDQEASNITNSTVLQGNNPFASNFERSLENGTDVRTNRPFTFTPPNQTTVTRPRNNNPFASNFERTFNLNVGG